MGRYVLFSLLLFGWIGTTGAQSRKVNLDAKTSELSYTGHHTLHDWTGVNRSLNGTLELDPANPAGSRISITAPVEGFDSGNSNRDSNMLDVVEAESYPDVQFMSSAVRVERWDKTANGYAGRWIVDGTLSFHGKKNTVQIPVDVDISAGVFKAEGRFQLVLSAYKIKRPKLLLKPIDDVVDVQGVFQARL